MKSETSITLLLVGILIYKTLDLAILREKVAQAFLRGNRLPDESPALRSPSARLVVAINNEFPMITLVYFLATATILGITFIIAQGDGAQNYLTAKVVSGVTIVASIFQAVLSIAVEHYRTLIERN